MKAHKSIFIMLIIALFSSAPAWSNDQLKVPNKLCGQRLSSLKSALDSGLEKSNWVIISTKECPETQEDIINNLPQVINSKVFYDYLPFMSKKTLRLVRNAFFAAKGYRFKSPELQSFYEKFDWYKPSQNNAINLSSEEKNRVKLLRGIEDLWVISGDVFVYEPPEKFLSKSVAISYEGSIKQIKLGSKYVNLRPEIAAKNLSHKVQNIEEWNAYLVCTQPEDYESYDVYSPPLNLDLFSSDGKLLASKKIYGEHCPFWTPGRPNLLIHSETYSLDPPSLEYRLSIYDRNLNLVSSISTNDDLGGGPLTPFMDAQDGGFYALVTDAKEAISSTSGDKSSISFDYGGYGDEHWDANYIYRVNNNGSVDRVSESRKDWVLNKAEEVYHLADGTGALDLYGQESTDIPPSTQAKVALKGEKKIIMFFRETYYPEDDSALFVVVAPL